MAALQAGNYDAYLGEVRLTANFDLSEFFRTGGALSYGAVADASLAGLCTQALGNKLKAQGKPPPLCLPPRRRVPR